jgi:hypothetical protein
VNELVVDKKAPKPKMMTVARDDVLMIRRLQYFNCGELSKRLP